ncbi:MAG: TRAP transporter substrate-binding protein DctP [Pseudorhodoplanes sp.]
MIFRNVVRPIAVAALLCATGSILLAQSPLEFTTDAANPPAPPSPAAATIHLRIASGQKSSATYIYLLQSFFVPEMMRRVSARTPYKLVIEEGYGGSIVRSNETLEHVESGDVDIGAYCFCHEPANLPLHSFQVMLPFGAMNPSQSVKIAREVYEKVPYMTKVFEDKYAQKLIALSADSGYNLATSFEWDKVSDLAGRKIAGAGLNLKWVENAGAIPVQSSLPEARKAMQTDFYQGWIMFPAGWLNYKLYDVGKYYTEVGFGSITWHGVTINKAKFETLPKEVQDILLEVGREYEAMTGTVNEANYPKQIDELKAKGMKVRKLPDSVRAEWAKSLADWPREKAKELDAEGLPATQVLEATIAAAERAGHKWPVRYVVR